MRIPSWVRDWCRWHSFNADSADRFFGCIENNSFDHESKTLRWFSESFLFKFMSVSTVPSQNKQLDPTVSPLSTCSCHQDGMFPRDKASTHLFWLFWQCSLMTFLKRSCDRKLWRNSDCEWQMRTDFLQIRHEHLLRKLKERAKNALIEWFIQLFRLNNSSSTVLISLGKEFNQSTRLVLQDVQWFMKFRHHDLSFQLSFWFLSKSHPRSKDREIQIVLKRMWNEIILCFSINEFRFLFCCDHCPVKVDVRTTDLFPFLRAWLSSWQTDRIT
jgi:hypothetical protein